MKKNIVFLLIACSSLAYAQKNNVQSAANALKYDEYAEAKTYIEKAAVHPKTINDPKMWYYRGRTYLAIHEEKLVDIDPDAIAKATESLIKCLEIDEREMFSDSAHVYLMRSAISCFYEGVDQFKKEQHQKAADLYGLVIKAIPYDKNKDLARNNVSEKNIYLYLYYAANGSKNKDKEKEYLVKLIGMNYNDANIYLYMSRILQEEKDTAAALGYIEKGRERFYDDNTLIGEQVDLSLKMGKSEELLARLSEDIEYDPGNHILYLVRGMLLEKKGEEDKAIADYKESININPDNFTANYNAGILYYNKGVAIMQAAKDIPFKEQDRYNKEKEKAEKVYHEALPYFEAAHAIDPKDEETAQGLLKFYMKLDETEKYEKLKAKLSN